MTQPSILAQIELTGAPLTRLYDLRDSNLEIENRWFSQWRLPLLAPAYWKKSSPFIIDEENGQRILECLVPDDIFPPHPDAVMITGDQDWADYTVSTQVRLISRHVIAPFEDPTAIDAMAGIVGRYQTNRHYYYLCISGRGRAILFCRDNLEWRILAETTCEFDPRVYVQLTLRFSGTHLLAQVGDTILFSGDDHRYSSGAAGIRIHGRARIDGVSVTALAEEEDQQKDRREQRLQKEKKIQSAFPQARLLARIPKPAWQHEIATLCRIAPGKWGLLLYNTSVLPPRIGGADLEGNLIWSREMELKFPTPHDADGDGQDEILGILDNRIVLVSLKDGSILRETPLPVSCPFQGNRGELIAPGMMPWYPADLRGTGKRRDFVIKDELDSHGGRTLWAYDSALNPLWTARVGFPRYGHTLSMCDINGDGRDEILAGFHCFDADGKLLWNCREAELNEDDHVDQVHLGFFGPNGEPRACGTNGDDGFYLLDALSGEVISCFRSGHVQGVSVGKYLPDRAGLSYCVGVRWGGFGLLNILDAEGNRVTTWEPDHCSQGGPAVKWTDRGEELILLTTSRESFGLWDGYGNRCVAMECPELPVRGKYFPRGQGEVVDFDGDGLDEVVFYFPEELFVYKAE